MRETCTNKAWTKCLVLSGLTIAVGCSVLISAWTLPAYCQNKEYPQTSTAHFSQLPLVPHLCTVNVSKGDYNKHGAWQRLEGDTWKDCSMFAKGAGPYIKVISRDDNGGCIHGEIDLADFCTLWQPGTYQLRWRTVEGKVAIGPLNLTIEEPQGVDKEVFEKLLVPRISGPLLGQDLLFWVYGDFDRFRERPPVINMIISDYPTSTYAGYVLAKRIPDYSNPLFKPVIPPQQVKMSRDEGKTVVTFSDKAFEKYFKQLEAFMKGSCVPDSVRIRLYCYYGDLLVQRGRFLEAEEAFKKAVLSKPQNEEDKAYFKRAQAFLTALKAKSPCRKIVEKGKD